MTNFRSRRLQWFAGIAVILVTWPALGTNTAVEHESYLYPEPRHEQIGELVTQFIERQHYNRIAVDDDLSSDVMDLFIESLDRNRMYLLKGDIEFFETFRYQLDDMVRGRSLAPVFDMYEVYQTRARERLQFALEALDTGKPFCRSSADVLLHGGRHHAGCHGQHLHRNRLTHLLGAHGPHPLIDRRLAGSV